MEGVYVRQQHSDDIAITRSAQRATDNARNLLESSECGRSCITPSQSKTIAPCCTKSSDKEQEDDKQDDESCPGH
eukprot:4603190-Karenia_brevis.AAC.1